MNVTRKEIEYKVDDMILYINSIDCAMREGRREIAAIDPYKLFEALASAQTVISKAIDQCGEIIELVEAEKAAKRAMRAALAAEANYLMPIKTDAQRIA